MKNIIWVIASDLGARSLIGEFVDTVKSKGNTVIDVSLEEVLTPSYVPSIPDKDKQPVLFYGPVNFVNRMSNHNMFTPGVYGNNDLFSYNNICQNIPAHMLFNSPEETVSGNVYNILNYIKDKKDNEDFFFKPGDDSKFIAGGIYSVQRVRNICNNIIHGRIELVDDKSPLLIGPLYGIDSEYRLFIVDGKIVAGSQYLPETQKDIPDNVIDFANTVLNIWQPVPIFILDICLSNGHPYIMEIQNFHSAGFYDADLSVLVDSVNQYVHNISCAENINRGVK